MEGGEEGWEGKSEGTLLEQAESEGKRGKGKEGKSEGTLVEQEESEGRWGRVREHC